MAIEPDSERKPEMAGRVTKSEPGSRPTLASVFRQDCIVELPPGCSKTETLRALVQSLVEAGSLYACATEPIVAGLAERELLGTTALGRGLAFPHLRTRRVERFYGAMGVCYRGIDFGSLDGQPTRLVLLLLSPFEERARHGELLSHLVALYNNRTLQLSLQSPSASTTLSALLSLE